MRANRKSRFKQRPGNLEHWRIAVWIDKYSTGQQYAAGYNEAAVQLYCIRIRAPQHSTAQHGTAQHEATSHSTQWHALVLHPRPDTKYNMKNPCIVHSAVQNRCCLPSCDAKHIMLEGEGKTQTLLILLKIAELQHAV